MKTTIYTILLSAAIVLLNSCSYDSDSAGFDSDTGTGGSMARFTVVGDYLYTLDGTNLKVFDVSDPASPEYKTGKEIGLDVETISPLGDKLFIGTESGMYIYDISTPTSPVQFSYYEHVVSCDPVVSDRNYAYVTLNSLSENCWNAVNELHIIDLNDMTNPELIAQYNMTSPRGMAIKNDTLWVCDNGLRIFDVKDKQNIVELYHFDNMEAYDVIRDEDRALVIGETGFVQYKLEGNSIRKLSEINVEL